MGSRTTQNNNKPFTINALVNTILQGDGIRARSVMMTVATVIIGLLPILYAEDTGSEVMSRIAVTMMGGLVTDIILTLLVLSAVYLLRRRSKLKR